MKTTIQKRYEDAEEIAEIPLGDLDDRIATLYHSKKEGYFLETFVSQKRVGSVWENISERQYYKDKENDLIDKRTRRRLKTFRPLSRDQAIRLFVEGFEEDEAGFFASIREALDRAGIEPLKE